MQINRQNPWQETHMKHTVYNPFLSADRMQVLFELSLIEDPEETIYNKVTAFASQAIGAPVSLLSMVATNYQYFKSEVGLPEPWKSEHRTPLTHSFCQHVVKENEPLIVSDARENPLVKDNLAIRDLNVIGYLGMPLTLEDGLSLGSLCVIDSDVRDWTQVEIDIMRELSAIIIKEFNARAYVVRKVMTPDKLKELQDRIIEFVDSINLEQDKSHILAEIRDERVTYNLT